MKLPAALKFVLSVAVLYGVFKAPALMGSPIPASLVAVYMFFCVITVILVMTSTEDGARSLFAPLRSLVEDPGKKAVRNAVFALLPLLAGAWAFMEASPSVEPPAELRAVHPAPPFKFRAYGRAFDAGTLVNPLRELEKKDPEAFAAAVREGGELYFKNCFFCHGAALDGRGHYAHAMSPRPLPFSGSDTIAQLQESYVFWRIVKGGPGLPREGAPWATAMPAWEDKLTEEEVWKTVLFLYSHTGNRPREWEGWKSH